MKCIMKSAPLACFSDFWAQGAGIRPPPRVAPRLRALVAMIAAVLFDMNDVLYRYDRGRRVARLAMFSGLTEAEVEAAIWGSGYEDSGDGGAMDADAYLAGFGARLGFGSPRTPGPRLCASR